VAGKPEITLKFPITELIIVIILIVIIIRLVFKKSEEELQEEQAKKLRKDIERHITYSRKEGCELKLENNLSSPQLNKHIIKNPF
jgi:hypothetical protein